jgi:hypothetical protein
VPLEAKPLNSSFVFPIFISSSSSSCLYFATRISRRAPPRIHFILASLAPSFILPSVRARSTINVLVRSLPQLRSVHVHSLGQNSRISGQSILSNARTLSATPTSARRLDHVSRYSICIVSRFTQAHYNRNPPNFYQIRRTLATTMPPITKEEGEGTEYDLFVIGGGSGGLACAVSFRRLHSIYRDPVYSIGTSKYGVATSWLLRCQSWSC